MLNFLTDDYFISAVAKVYKNPLDPDHKIAVFSGYKNHSLTNV